jgi:hypothetical protein
MITRKNNRHWRKHAASVTLATTYPTWSSWTMNPAIIQEQFSHSSCLYRASTVSKHFLLFHHDAHNYKITGILKQLKFRRSLRHVSLHAVTIVWDPFLCLAKTTVLVLYPRCLWCGQCHGSIPTMYRTPAQQVGMLPWHWRHKRRGYRTRTVVLAKHKNGSLMMVPAWTETCRSDRRNLNCFNIPVIL